MRLQQQAMGEPMPEAVPVPVDPVPPEEEHPEEEAQFEEGGDDDQPVEGVPEEEHEDVGMDPADDFAMYEASHSSQRAPPIQTPERPERHSVPVVPHSYYQNRILIDRAITHGGWSHLPIREVLDKLRERDGHDNHSLVEVDEFAKEQESGQKACKMPA